MVSYIHIRKIRNNQPETTEKRNVLIFIYISISNAIYFSLPSFPHSPTHHLYSSFQYWNTTYTYTFTYAPTHSSHNPTLITTTTTQAQSQPQYNDTYYITVPPHIATAAIKFALAGEGNGVSAIDGPVVPNESWFDFPTTGCRIQTSILFDCLCTFYPRFFWVDPFHHNRQP